MSEVFISYARSSEAEARRVEQGLRALGYQVWRDDELPAHRPYTDVIEERLRTSKAVLVLWSADAVKSQWVRAEAGVAREAQTLVQLSLDGAVPPLPFNQIQCADLKGWSGELEGSGWQKVVGSVAELVGRPPRRVRHQHPPSSPAPSTGPVAAPPSAPPIPLRRRIPAWAWAAVVLLLVALAGAGSWRFLGRSAQPPPTVVAVLPFDVAGSDPQARAFADSLLDELVGVLSNDHIQTLSRTESAALRDPNAGAVLKRLGVGLLLDGSVEATDGSIHVQLHLDDPARRAVIWSEEFSRTASEADALQAEVAAKAARNITQALVALGAGVSDPATLSDFVTGDEHQRFDSTGGWVAAEAYLRRVVARAPRFAEGHAYLAISEADESADPGNPRAAEQRADAQREAQAALSLDPKGQAYFAVAYLMTPAKDYWRAHEATLQKGMALDPTQPSYDYFLARDFANQGRLQSAAELIRRAVALDSFWPGPQKDFALDLMATGQAIEGQQALDRMERLWPDNWATIMARFWTAALYGDPDAASSLLADPRTRPSVIDSRSAELWQAALHALKSNRPNERAKAAAAISSAAGAGPGQFPPAAAVLLLAQLGEVESAFAVADEFPLQVELGGVLGGPPVLFISKTEALRRDPRFMSLAAKVGLVDYWRSTGNWPDFCSEPGLPYDCKAEAARLTPKRPS